MDGRKGGRGGGGKVEPKADYKKNFPLKKTLLTIKFSIYSNFPIDFYDVCNLCANPLLTFFYILLEHFLFVCVFLFLFLFNNSLSIFVLFSCK